MEIRNSFEVPLPPDAAWKVLMDIPGIVPCMPGAELTEFNDDGSFKGMVSVKLGPVALTFNGVAQFEERDAQAHHARVKGQGSDAKGRGGANATVTFDLHGMAEKATRVDVVTDVDLSGPVAQYGRGAGVIQGVATEIVGQFATNLRAKLDGKTPSQSTPGRQPNSIGGLSLLWIAMKGALRGIFLRKAP